MKSASALFFDEHRIVWTKTDVLKVSIKSNSIVYTMYIHSAKGMLYLNHEQQKGMVFMTTATVKKWGNSLAVRLPIELTNRVNITDGIEVEMTITENKEIVIRPTFPPADDQEALRAHFLALRAKCKPGLGKHEEVFAKPIGDEII